MINNRPTLRTLLTTALFLLAFNANSDSKNELEVVGKKEFLSYCASCHGSDGKGNGPIVDFLKRKPIDLTQLSKNNSGIFPFDRIYGVFTGAYVFKEHGTSEMPVWGYRFVEDAKASKQASVTAKAKALDIILYLQVIQE